CEARRGGCNRRRASSQSLLDPTYPNQAPLAEPAEYTRGPPWPHPSPRSPRPSATPPRRWQWCSGTGSRASPPGSANPHPSAAGSLSAFPVPHRPTGPGAGRYLAAGAGPLVPSSGRLIRAMQEQDSAARRELLARVYAALPGPSYETPAEIRALRVCGADAVGMSTAREAIAAGEAGMEVAAVSLITNRAAGLSDAPLSHEEVMAAGAAAAGQMAALIE